jgi:hypothetical protein
MRLFHHCRQANRLHEAAQPAFFPLHIPLQQQNVPSDNLYFMQIKLLNEDGLNAMLKKRRSVRTPFWGICSSCKIIYPFVFSHTQS